MSAFARLLLIGFIILLAIANVACPQHSPVAPPVAVVSDYMPQWNVGDSSFWKFSQTTFSTSQSGHMLDGNIWWKVIAVDNSNGERTTHIQRVFTGWLNSWTTNLPGLGYDSVFVKADTTVFLLTEDAAHKITIDLTASSSTIQYVGYSVSFDRFYAGGTGKDVVVQGFFYSVTLRESYGIAVFEFVRGGTMIAPKGNYTRIQ